MTPHDGAPPPSDPGLPVRPGAIVGDRFRVGSYMASGGVGIIFSAEDLKTRATVAIKFLRLEYARDAVWIKRFEREALASSQLGHPHIVRIIHFAITREGLPFFAMEHLRGHDLAHEIRQRGTLSPPRLVTVLVQTAHALAMAHRAGIVHRDLKPSNLFLVDQPGGDDVVKVLDFGLAKFAGGDSALDRLTRTGEILGTPEFMSPEQARGRPLDHRTDLYSLGVIAYAMATGQLPFTSPDAVSVLLKHVYDPPPPMASKLRGATLPDGIERAILALLAKEPEGRPGDALEFMRSLPGWQGPASRLARFPL